MGNCMTVNKNQNNNPNFNGDTSSSDSAKPRDERTSEFDRNTKDGRVYKIADDLEFMDYKEEPMMVPKYAKQRSTINFGELYGLEFKQSVVEEYKQNISLQAITDEKDNECKTNNDQISQRQLNIVQYYHDNYYGQNEVFESPFGIRPVIYCDWTASGKCLDCVETYIDKEVSTLYANTHTQTSVTGVQTSKFRSEARSIILESLHGDVDQDAVIFCGSGVTGAIYKMANVLMKSISKSYKPETTIVFISIYEHNSNIYIWKELGIKVIVIPENESNPDQGHIDLNLLEKYLKFYTTSQMKHKYNLLIGSFTAASNVSGIIAPIDDITRLLHRYNALSFWDYATAGPYMDINMTNKNDPEISKDAVFIATHKYLAGPGSPGILCAKRKLFSNYVPVVAGGGTVYVAWGIRDAEWEYLDNIEEKEEGGTPDIIGSIRASFAFQIKDHLTTHFIELREEQYVKYFFNETKGIENLQIIGNTKCRRLPILSFNITHTSSLNGKKQTKYLHHNYIAALFNDLFGIQGRGGCACAGMYGVKELGLSNKEVNHVTKQMRDYDNELARPGYFRINLHYTLTENELKYIVSAAKYICENAWRFLPYYDIDISSGIYYHRKNNIKNTQKILRSLLDISFNKNNGEMTWKQKHLRVNGNELQKNLNRYFKMADDFLLTNALPSKKEFSKENQIHDTQCWYWLPSEIYQELRKQEKQEIVKRKVSNNMTLEMKTVSISDGDMNLLNAILSNNDASDEDKDNINGGATKQKQGLE